MSTEKVRCFTCKGRKTIVGMGGMVKDCKPCNGKGYTQAVKAKVIPTMSDEPIETVDMFGETQMQSCIAKEPIQDTCSLEDMFPGVSEIAASMTDDIVHAIDNKNKPVDEMPKEVHKKKEAEAGAPKPLWPGLDDEFVRAIMAEPGMDPLEWAAKYRNVPRLFGQHVVTGQHGELMSKVQRNQMRLMFAQSKPNAPRKVDIMASMNGAADKDPEYIAYKIKEEDRLEKELSKAKKRKIGGV